jgi:Protein of unknown function (DUF2384)
MVLEPEGIQTVDIRSAMDQVFGTLATNSPRPGGAYGVLVYGAREPEPQKNVLVAVQTFFKAYKQAWNVLSHIPNLGPIGTATFLHTIENKEFGRVRLFFGEVTKEVLKEKRKASPGVYIMTGGLDLGLLKVLNLPPLPLPFRDLPLVMQVEHAAETTQVYLPSIRTVGDQQIAAESAGDREKIKDEVEAVIDRDTLDWRRRFMRTNSVWNSAQVAAESTSTARNRAAIASRWLREKKIFGLRYEGQQVFPRFQFQDGSPSPVIAKVISRFPEHATGWDFAYFFATPNPHLGGRKPLELLKSNPDRVLSLAQAFAHPADVF